MFGYWKKTGLTLVYKEKQKTLDGLEGLLMRLLYIRSL